MRARRPVTSPSMTDEQQPEQRHEPVAIHVNGACGACFHPHGPMLVRHLTFTVGPDGTPLIVWPCPHCGARQAFAPPVASWWEAIAIEGDDRPKVAIPASPGGRVVEARIGRSDPTHGEPSTD